MQRIKLKIPDARKFQFRDDLTAWEKGGNQDVHLIAGDAAEPYKTTTPGMPLVFSCEVDETFFEKYPEWLPHVISRGGSA